VFERVTPGLSFRYYVAVAEGTFRRLKKMKMAKTLAIIFALVLAVICFYAPPVIGGDEHPWDEEGGNDSEGNSSGEVITAPPPLINQGSDGGSDWYGSYDQFIMYLEFLVWYNDIPNTEPPAIETTKDNGSVNETNASHK
jgi:hypothetical protein